MIIYPAIDLKGGQCVRLLRGDMEKATVFSHDPAGQARLFEDAGFTWLHLVDLDGACAGESRNGESVESIIQQVRIPVQLGGGIRTLEHIVHWLEKGVSRVILGTVAARQPQLVIEACKRFPDKIAVGIDTRKGMVAVEGWVNDSSLKASELALRFENAGVAAIIYTDIDRDGALKGPNLEQTAALAASISTPVILSGGVTALSGLTRIRSYGDKGINGVIVGRVLYEGSLNYQDALRA